MIINKENKMEMNKASVSIISILITLALSFGTFCYKTGTTNNELKNLKETINTVKKDLKEDIKEKADKNIVDLIFQDLNKINSKLDKLIEKGNK